MNKDIIIPFIFAIGCFVFFWLDIPQYDNILDIKAAIAERQIVLIERTKMRENAVSLMQQYETRKNDIDKLGILFPNSVRMDQIIETLQSVAVENGVFIKDMSVGFDDKTSSDIISSSAKLSVNATQESVMSFIKAMESSLKIFNVGKYTITKNDSQAESNLFNIEIEFETYSLNPKNESTSTKNR
jgi:hypothetical protein